MGEKRPTVLVVDDEAHILKTMGICFKELEFETKLCSKSQEALDLTKKEIFDLAFIDLKMIPIDGIAILEQIKKFSPETTVIIITAHGSIESAIEAIKKGAYDYLQKPFDYLELQIFAKKALEYHQLKSEVKKLRAERDKALLPGNIITKNSKMIEMINLAERIAETNMSVLIEGESGTGKELFAQFINQKSDRADKPFIKVNCAALPENLLESELFGHVKGAFTGAIKDRQGRFELADKGTIFLDEIAELTPSVQAKLLRVLQQKEFERLGESQTRKVDVRIIAATNKNLEEALKEGTFREDLYYRLNSVRIKLLPLRERPEDIPVLIRHFFNKFTGEQSINISLEALKALKLYRWSGNVRELENTIQRAVLLAKNNCIELTDLPEEVRLSIENQPQNLTLEEAEKLHIKKVIQTTADLNHAAQILGIDPATLWRKRKKYNL